MHIPDGFLTLPVAVIMDVVAVVGIGYSLKNAKKTLKKEYLVPLGIACGLIFALQMLNFPVAEGTSGHYMGGVFLAILFGPFVAVLGMAGVLIVQCLLFGDGGLVALGANIFNMGIIGGAVMYYIYQSLRRIFVGSTGRLFCGFIASWLSIVGSSASCAFLLAISGTAPLGSVLLSMISIHMLIGICEGLILVIFLSMLNKFWPALLEQKKEIAPPRLVLSIGILLALGLATFVSPFACPYLDGLERVAENHNFIHLAERSVAIFQSPIPDYLMPGIKSERVATSLAGLTGTIFTFIFFWITGKPLLKKKDR